MADVAADPTTRSCQNGRDYDLRPLVKRRVDDESASRNARTHASSCRESCRACITSAIIRNKCSHILHVVALLGFGHFGKACRRFSSITSRRTPTTRCTSSPPAGPCSHRPPLGETCTTHMKMPQHQIAQPILRSARVVPRLGVPVSGEQELANGATLWHGPSNGGSPVSRPAGTLPFATSSSSAPPAPGRWPGATLTPCRFRRLCRCQDDLDRAASFAGRRRPGRGLSRIASSTSRNCSAWP